MGHPTILVNLGAPFTRRVGPGPAVQVDGGMLLFQQTCAAEHRFVGETHVVGAALAADAGGLMLQRDVSLDTDRSVPLADVFGASWRAAASLIARSADGEAGMDQLQTWLHSRELSQIDSAVRQVLERLQRDPASSIGTLASESGLSHKQMIARFKARVGVTPKRLATLLRMAATLGRLAEMSHPDWAQVAADAGFADQAHFARAFKSFSGLTPGEYGKRRRWAEETVGMEDESGFFVPQPDDESG